MRAPDLAMIFDSLEGVGAQVRFIGGAVRNHVLRRDPTDIDLATDATPDRVQACLEKAAIKVVPTGIEHGTLTAVVRSGTVEITTLRRDVSSDGRHATIAFTEDWREDAWRRDFTMNALSMDPDGTVYDYTGGYDDAVAGRVRFIGNAEDRIREDVLRILRFFRVHAQYGCGTHDPAGLAACEKLAGLLAKLSAERVWSEMSRVLGVDEPAPHVSAMADAGALAYWLPEAVPRTIRWLQEYSPPSGPGRTLDAVARLSLASGAAVSGNLTAAAELADRLKLSNRERALLTLLADPPLRPGQGKAARNEALFQLGRDSAVAVVQVGLAVDPEAWSPLAEYARDWNEPQFPLSGCDVLAEGIAPGIRVGQLLACVREWWFTENCVPNRSACIAEMRRILSSDARNMP